MKARITLPLLAILFVAALSSPGGNTTIKASYENPVEPVTFIQNTYLEPAITPFLQSTAPYGQPTLDNVIIRETFGLVLGTHYYAINAADEIGNQAIHGTSITVDQAGLIQGLESPSTYGQAEFGTFTVALRTKQQAQCRYSFWAPGETPVWKPLTVSPFIDKTLHILPNYSDDYRFRAGELIPIQFHCFVASGETVINSYRTYTIGRADGTYPTTTKEIIPPSINSLTSPEPRLEIHSDEVIICDLDGTKTLPGRHHRFTLTEGTTSTIKCHDTQGALLFEEPVRINSVPGAPSISITTPSTTRRQSHVIAETGSPARCTYSHNGGPNTELGPLSEYLLHQTAITFNEGSNTLSINCVDKEGGADDTVTKTIIADNTGPQATIKRAENCEDNTVILELERGAADLAYYKIKGPNGRAILRTWPTGENTIVIQQGGIGTTGQLAVLGYDKLGNRPSSPQTTTIQPSTNPQCMYEGYDQDIILRQPEGASTSSSIWNLEVETELASTCTATAPDGTVTNMTSTNGNYHTATNFNERGVTMNRENTVTVTCKDFAGYTTERDFTIKWFTQPPVIHAHPAPETVTDPSQQRTIIVVEADQEVSCRVGTGEFDVTYNRTRYLPLDMPYGVQEKTVTVWCTNGPFYADVNVTAYENIPCTLFIELTSDSLTNKAPVPISIRTNRGAACQVTGAATGTLATTDGTNHEGSYTIAEGEKLFTTTCTETQYEQKTCSKQFTITIDRTPPTYYFTSPRGTCGPNNYVVAANISDEHTITDINITFANQEYHFTQADITEGVFSKELVELNLTPGNTYPVTMTATDAVGNKGSKITRSVIAYEEGGGVCDTEPPSVSIGTEEKSGGVDVWVTCTDDIGCVAPYGISIGPLGGQCYYNSIDPGERKTVTTDSQVCARASDAAGNTGTTKKDITVVARPGHCYNDERDSDETGIDCGGDDCAACGSNSCVDPGNECSTGYTCDTTTGECREINGACDGDTCDQGYECVNNYCVLIDEDCTPGSCPEGKKCDVDDGTCKTDTGVACTTKDDCENNEKCVGGTCVEDTNPVITCQNDADCDATNGYTCELTEEGVKLCIKVPGGTCTTSNDCDGDAVCDEGECKDVPDDWCWDNNDCAGALICVDNNCMIENDPYCTQNDDCLGDQVCLSTGVCGVQNPATCESEDIECGPNQVCEDGTCVTSITSCEADEQCPTGLVCLANGNCAIPTGEPCVNNTCAEDSFCNEETNECATPVTDYCEDNNDCGGDLVCTEDNECAAPPVNQCTKDGDCGFERECVGGDCYSPLPDPCFTDIQCGPDMICDEDSGSCVSYVPPACRYDRECGDDGDCITGKCYYPEPDDCDDDGDCPDNRYCIWGLCSLRQTTPTNNTNTCYEDSDCAGGVCTTQGYCAAGNDEDCINGKKDCQETGVDCGGAYAPACENGETCKIHTDCESKTCISGKCKEPSCTDGTQNGKESDKDCGGNQCKPCDLGKKCIDVDTLEPVDEYCYSNICAYGECASERPPPDIIEPGDTGNNGWDGGDAGTITPPTKDSIWPALIFILLGILLAGGGAGYIFYEKQEEEKTARKKPSSTSIAFGTPAGGTGLGTINKSAPSYETEDFSNSKLREEARNKRRNQRISKRKNLLSAFEDDASKEISEDNDTSKKHTTAAKTVKTDDDPATKAATKTKTASPGRTRKKAAPPKKKALASKEIMDEPTKKASKKPEPASSTNNTTPKKTATPLTSTTPSTTTKKEPAKKPSTTQTPPKKTAVVPPPKNTLTTEPSTIHKQFQKAKTPAALEELAKEFLDKGDANKHEISSALKDLESAGNVKKKTVDDLHKKLEL